MRESKKREKNTLALKVATTLKMARLTPSSFCIIRFFLVSYSRLPQAPVAMDFIPNIDEPLDVLGRTLKED